MFCEDLDQQNEKLIRSTRLKPHFVETASDVDRRALNDIIDDLRERGEEIGRSNLRVEEDLGGEEALPSNVDAVFPSSDAVLAFEPGEPLVRVVVVLFELFDHVLANVGVVLLDPLGTMHVEVGQ